MSVIQEAKLQDNSNKTISMMSLKILLFLNHNNGNTSFKELTSYLNRSKSQVSLALKKLKNLNYILRSHKRPQVISITKQGKLIKNQTLREMLKFNQKKNKNIVNLKNPEKNVGSPASLTYYTKNGEKDESYHRIQSNQIYSKNFHGDDYYKDILIGFFIELPEILLDLNVNLTPDKYHKFKEEIKLYLINHKIFL